MRGHERSVSVGEHPREADPSAAGTHREARLPHLRERRRREDPDPVGGGPVGGGPIGGGHIGGGPIAEVEPGIAKQIAGGRAHATDRMTDAPRFQRTAEDDRCAVANGVARGKPVGEDIVGEERGVAHPERDEQQLGHRGLVAAAGDDLDDPAGDRERDVVIREVAPGRDELAERRHRRDPAGERVVPRAGVLEVLTDPSGGVGEQVRDGDRRGHLGVGDAKVRQVPPDRRIESKPSVGDEPHRDRRGHRLGHRRDLEDRVRVDGERLLHVRDAGADDLLPAVGDDADRSAGDDVQAHAVFQPRPQGRQPVGGERHRHRDRPLTAAVRASRRSARRGRAAGRVDGPVAEAPVGGSANERSAAAAVAGAVTVFDRLE